MSPDRVRRQTRAETRALLLEAAARVFAERGFRGASVEAVCDEAGFSTGALYSNFASKEELFLSLYEERIRRRSRELREATEKAGGGAKGLASAAGTFGDSLREDRDFFLLYFEFALHAARNPKFADRFGAVRDDGLHELAEGIREGLHRAGVPSDTAANDLARTVRALSYGLALDRLVDKDEVADDLLARILRLLFAGIRADAGS